MQTFNPLQDYNFAFFVPTYYLFIIFNKFTCKGVNFKSYSSQHSLCLTSIVDVDKDYEKLGEKN